MIFTKNPGFLQAVILHIAETRFESEMECDDIPVNQDKNEYIEDFLKEAFDEVSKKVKIMPDETPPNPEEILLAKKFYTLPIGGSTHLDTDSDIMRVPGGWVFSSSTAGSMSSTFVPFSNEFLELSKKDIDEHSLQATESG